MLHYATLGSESNLNMKAALLGNFVKKKFEYLLPILSHYYVSSVIQL